MTEETWRLETGGPDDHLTRLTSTSGRKAVFKQPRDADAAYKPIELANELLAYKLAIRIGLPVTETRLLNLNGHFGILSVIQSEINWSQAPESHKTSPNNAALLRLLLVFDLWIANTDRKPDHVIFLMDGNFYPIDHSHVFNGCTHSELKWSLETVNDVSKFPLKTFPHPCEGLVKNYAELEPAIIKIEAISDVEIDATVEESLGEVCTITQLDEETILRTNFATVSALLKSRRNSIHAIVREWCMVKGKTAT